MRCCNDVLCITGLCVGEVGAVVSHLAAFQRSDHIIIVDQFATGIVQHTNAVLHLCDGSSVDHALCVLVERYVNGQIICRSEYVVLGLDNCHRRIQTQCCANRQERVSTNDLHAQCNCGICHQRTDSAQTDDTQGLALDLRTCELALALFHLLCHRCFAVFQSCCPCHCLRNLTGGDEQTGQHQFLYGIGIGTRCVEYTDASLRAAIQRNVVDACAGTGNCLQIVTKRGVVKGCAADQDGIWV